MRKIIIIYNLNIHSSYIYAIWEVSKTEHNFLVSDCLVSIDHIFQPSHFKASIQFTSVIHILMSQSTGQNFDYYYPLSLSPFFLLLSNYSEQCDIRKQNSFYSNVVSLDYMFYHRTMPQPIWYRTTLTLCLCVSLKIIWSYWNCHIVSQLHSIVVIAIDCVHILQK